MDQSSPVFAVNLNRKAARLALKWGAVIAGVVFLITLLPALQSVVSIVAIAGLLSFLLEPLVAGFENRGIDRLLAAVLVFALILFVGMLGFRFLAPAVGHEITALSRGISQSESGNALKELQSRLGENIPILSNPGIQKELENKVNDLLKSSFSVVVDILSAVVSLVMVAFMTFFFLKDGRRMKKTVISWVPNRYFEMALIIIHKTGTQLGRYLRGQMVVSMVVGTLSITALYLLDIRYSFFIGALAGLANVIPYFGPLVGALPAIVIAFLDTGDPGLVLAVAIAFACIQLFENIFVSPFIVSKSVELHPLLIIIVILIGGQLFGLFGMLLAVPVASIIKVMVREISWGLRNYRILT